MQDMKVITMRECKIDILIIIDYIDHNKYLGTLNSRKHSYIIYCKIRIHLLP